MSDYFCNKVILLTGASSGIGRALALELAQKKARVGLLARREPLLQELTQEFLALDVPCALAVADVSRRDDVQRAARQVADQLGPIDILIANAGVGTPTFLDPVNIQDVERMFQVNLFGMIYAIEAVLPTMLQRRAGQIAAVSSLAAFKGLPGESAYCASKAAMNIYLEGLRIQLREKKIAVTTICPGFVHTPMTAANDFHMPMAMSAAQAATNILRAIARRKKIYRFPRAMSWLMRLTSILPDWVIARSMNQYNEKPPVNSIG